ncbi:polyprenyl synthetase family protein [Dissulfurirhabdus thermomarina]|uniref:Polyprenyl synthetase family protein n=1 Tax=Dissulfurirhabdus thermomarina TaxID=1765737 RepID=A0A6N9TNK4_DISTH|nr:polyprenyl synthetase family protein [Dissulfurirhabdus thermomarina]NDY41673.1 polyprenyl synthetase family protein [Dissulfurirhabdus thermomarina]NMX22759.1 polyprenyl synthetase family protein [Dissulfurirhabdus thermomarina]
MDDRQDITAILEACAPDFERIEAALQEDFHSQVPFVTEVSGYILFAGGKRLRPLITVLAARLCGRDDGGVFSLSVVPEYLHAASLLHDDVLDGGQLRRGKPPAYKVWGNKAAVLVGDFLYARAIDIASSFGLAEISRVIAETVALMAEGEILQLLQAKNTGYDEATYDAVIFRKTAVLISAAARIGALFAGAAPELVAAADAYGQALGRAYQMVDDLLDYTADTAELGKRTGTDLAEGKVTLPVILAMARAGREEQRRLRGLFASGGGGEDDFRWVRGLIEQTGAAEEARRRAEAQVSEALAALAAFPPSRPRGILEGLARYVLERKK